MFYYISIFFLLFLKNKNLPLFHSLILGLTLFPALFYLFSFMGGKVFQNIYLDAFTLIVLFAFITYRSFIALKHMIKSNYSEIINLFVLTFFFSCFAFIFHNSFILPGHDPIAAPSLAKLIYKAGCFPKTLAPLSDQPFSYPPGFSIFLSVFYIFKNPFLVLLIYKYLNIVVTAMIPALWAYYFNKIYKLDFMKSHLILICFYFGFFLFDRTLNLALAFAGKNAVLYSFMLFPAVFYVFLRKNKTVFDKTIVVLSLLGMMLVHYSFLIMFPLLIFFHISVNFSAQKNNCIKYISLFFLSVLLFIPFYLHIKTSSFIALNIPDASWANAWAFFKDTVFSNTGPNSDYLFWIYYPFKILWSFKKIFLLLFFLIPGLYIIIRKHILGHESNGEEKTIFKVISILFLSISSGIVFSTFLLAKPLLHVEYIRWFIHIYYSLLGSAFFIFICNLILKSKNKYAVRIFFMGFLIFFPITHFVFLNDFRHAYRNVNLQKISYGKMKKIQALLEKISKGHVVNLITESGINCGPGWYLTIQNYKPLEYYAVVSECRILNGSWITLPFESSREILELPSRTFYDSNNIYPLFYIGKEDTINSYLKKVDGVSAFRLNYRIDDNWIFKIEVPKKLT